MILLMMKCISPQVVLSYLKNWKIKIYIHGY
jgi:hypothetical protein